MLNFDILDKGLGIVSAAHFKYDFSAKLYIKLYSINWPISLSDCLYFLRYWATCALQLFVNKVLTS